jgi:hypothetical protein
LVNNIDIEGEDVERGYELGQAIILQTKKYDLNYLKLAAI